MCFLIQVTIISETGETCEAKLQSPCSSEAITKPTTSNEV